MIAIWLDDLRPMPEKFDVHVKTAKEAIDLLKKGNVSRISFDHDLGEGAGDGYQVAMFILEQAFLAEIPRLEWQVHSMNVVGKDNITHAMRQADKCWDELEF